MTYYTPKPYKPTPLELFLSKESRFLTRFLRRLQDGLLLTRGELADLGGKGVVATMLAPELKNVDAALPQGWLDYWSEDDYESVRIGTVWAYPESSIWGLPFPVTQEAKRLLDERTRMENKAS